MARSRGRSADASIADAKPRSDIYVGLLLISLVAMIVGCVLLLMDYNQYPSTEPPPPPARTK